MGTGEVLFWVGVDGRGLFFLGSIIVFEDSNTHSIDDSDIAC